MGRQAKIVPTGHTQVKSDRNGRTRSFWIFWRDADGRHGKKLGPAHVKDTGRRTARGATIWRAGDGPRPTIDHLTPKDAEAHLATVLAEAPSTTEPTAASGALRDAAEAWMVERAATSGLKRSTRLDYEDLFERLYRDLGEDTPVDQLEDQDLPAYFLNFEAQRVVGKARAERARLDGETVRSVVVSRWTAQPAGSVPVEVRTRAQAVAAAKELGGRWKHVARGVYRVTPPGAERARRVGRAEAQRLGEEGYAVERRETERWVLCSLAAAQTRNKYRDLLSAVLDLAVRKGWLGQNPLAAVARVTRRADRRRILRRDDFYSPIETRQLLEHVPELFSRAFYLCGFHAGFRLPGEALGLRWGAVDFDANVIRVYDNWVRNEADGTKTSDSEAVPMTPELRAALLEVKRRSYRTGDADHAFTRDPLGRPVADKELREAFRAAHEAAGLKPIPMYNTRHSFGTALARAGIPARTIQALMRHARITTTEQYMAYAPQPDLAEQISRALQSKDPNEEPRYRRPQPAANSEQFFAILEEEIPAKWLAPVRSAFHAAGLT